MYKTVWLLRRNPAMTREEFVEYYETKHSKLVGHFDGVVKYFRRYPEEGKSLAERSTPGGVDFDVVMELWFESREAFDAAHERGGADADFWREAAEDERRLFDVDSAGWQTKITIEVEHETDLSSPTLETTYERGVTSWS
ncbi:MAG: EthD domain-containing protein [Actinobacteria bacterium]|nr:EthD domain-containing protein [Actinomycetota bacterium]